jgi:hypothetical protein
MKHMRAVVQERYGGPEEVLHLREVAIPARIVGRTFSLEGARGNPTPAGRADIRANLHRAVRRRQNRKYTNNRPGCFMARACLPKRPPPRGSS